jgi:hypothetical protein
MKTRKGGEENGGERIQCVSPCSPLCSLLRTDFGTRSRNRSTGNSGGRFENGWSSTSRKVRRLGSRSLGGCTFSRRAWDEQTSTVFGAPFFSPFLRRSSPLLLISQARHSRTDLPIHARPNRPRRLRNCRPTPRRRSWPSLTLRRLSRNRQRLNPPLVDL